MDPIIEINVDGLPAPVSQGEYTAVPLGVIAAVRANRAELVGEPHPDDVEAAPDFNDVPFVEDDDV